MNHYKLNLPTILRPHVERLLHALLLVSLPSSQTPGFAYVLYVCLAHVKISCFFPALTYMQHICTFCCSMPKVQCKTRVTPKELRIWHQRCSRPRGWMNVPEGPHHVD